ncbi:hypothetical protein [Mesorhizobium sp. WSM2239]|uniref:Uncharacterized protein n=2 Tax=unclassified Mesorhizobium TaxID=325217 RepID=A0AAU8DD01_9HYPH
MGASRVIGRKLILIFEWMIGRIPFVERIHQAAKRFLTVAGNSAEGGERGQNKSCSKSMGWKAPAPPVLRWHRLGWTNRERSNGDISTVGAGKDQWQLNLPHQFLCVGAWPVLETMAGALPAIDEGQPFCLS